MAHILAHWVHSIDPIFIRFPEGFFLQGIYWYGMAYFLGFVIAGLLLHLYHKKGLSPLGPEEQSSLMMILILGVLIGGRLGYVLLYQTQDFLTDPLLLFRVWERGMASHGGFVGVTLAIVYFAKKHHYSPLAIADISISLAPPGLFLGRIANFVNGELWGKPSELPWAVIFPQSAPSYMPSFMIAPRHPSQLYEALLEGLILFIYTQYRLWNKHKTKTPHGSITGEFLIAYALLRILGECFREPDAALILGLQAGQFYSILVALGGIIVIAFSRKSSAAK